MVHKYISVPIVSLNSISPISLRTGLIQLQLALLVRRLILRHPAMAAVERL
jgi:hypothetical protein